MCELLELTCSSLAWGRPWSWEGASSLHNSVGKTLHKVIRSWLCFLFSNREVNSWNVTLAFRAEEQLRAAVRSSHTIHKSTCGHGWVPLKQLKVRLGWTNLWAHGHSSRRVHSHWSAHVRMPCRNRGWVTHWQGHTAWTTLWCSCQSTYGSSLKSQKLSPAADNASS